MMHATLRYVYLISSIITPLCYAAPFLEDPLLTEENALPAGKNLLHTKHLIQQQLVTLEKEIAALIQQRWENFEQKGAAPQDILDKISVLRLDQDDLQNQLVIIENTLQDENLDAPRN